MRPLTCDQLRANPELGVLDVLASAIDVSLLALAAAHPELRDDDRVTDPQALAALDIVDMARALGAIVHRYRLALAFARDHDHDDDIF
jgi:hypothetical protein